MIQNDDASLYNKAINKDRIAFEILYDRYEKLLYSFAYRLTNDASLTEEVVQDVFLKLWNGTNVYDESKGKLSSWLLTITRNKAIDEIRKRKRHTHEEIIDKDSLVQDEDSVEDKIEWNEQKINIQRAMNSLKEDQQQIINLFYFKGLSQQKIANQCELPLGTVKGRIRIALKHLRKMLAQEGGTSNE
ncbi:sigma-70 family RNA polymerase sigma factor [Metabacillus litoralis]|uniref:Sigma-70 family RNA polymerase sigma factor n=1 Tax=Metabacillus litoralis TaxID=152268 RepID=A0A5C6W1W0_9BACI|nr:sigma-70 family RNA polymerase sigma factor [Metabacillus litoralis]TXC89769.1 sigma-70 family RNA polymerase sigma factor [Metabacillus litoralis]